MSFKLEKIFVNTNWHNWHNWLFDTVKPLKHAFNYNRRPGSLKLLALCCIHAACINPHQQIYMPFVWKKRRRCNITLWSLLKRKNRSDKFFFSHKCNDTQSSDKMEDPTRAPRWHTAGCCSVREDFLCDFMSSVKFRDTLNQDCQVGFTRLHRECLWSHYRCWHTFRTIDFILCII